MDVAATTEAPRSYPIAASLNDLDGQWSEVAVQTSGHWTFHLSPYERDLLTDQMVPTGLMTTVQARRADGRMALLAGRVPTHLQKRCVVGGRLPQKLAA